MVKSSPQPAAPESAAPSWRDDEASARFTPMNLGLGGGTQLRGRVLSRLVGFYQKMFRQLLDHFFPEGLLEQVDDRSFIRFDDVARGYGFCELDEDGVAMNLTVFRTSYRFYPGAPAPFLESERRLLQTIVHLIHARFQAIYDPTAQADSDFSRHALEDLVVAHALDPSRLNVIASALEVLRVSGLSTYENRRISTGALLLGTDYDPTAPQRIKPADAQPYTARLSSLKRFHRICDGINTVFVVDREGDLIWPVEIRRWADQAHGEDPLPDHLPCPKPYHAHAKATLRNSHLCVVLTPFQEIKVFHQGSMAFAYSDARWRLLDIPAKFAAWREAVEAKQTTDPPDLAARIFRAALNLSEGRSGALFVLLRDPDESLSRLVDVSDLIQHDEEDEEENETAMPIGRPPSQLAKRTLHHLVRDQTLSQLDGAVMESLARVDGAFVTDLRGRLHAFGAILKIPPDLPTGARAVEGARTAAALAASFHGPVLKVSEDGFLTMFLAGRRIWEI